MPAKKIFRFYHQAMSTFFEVFISGHDETYSRSAAQEFFREIDRLERLLSRFDPGSEISMINRLSPGEGLPLGVETFECLKAGFELMVATGGAFNLNYRVLEKERRKEDLSKAGKSSAQKKEKSGSMVKVKDTDKPGSGQEEKNKNRKNFKKATEEMEGQEKPEGQLNNLSSGPNSIIRKLSWGVENSKEDGGAVFAGSSDSETEYWQRIFPLELLEVPGGYLAVRLKVPGAELDLDLGAIGKGYALEKASQIFSEWEISDFLVNAGQSTVYACGKKTWPVALGSSFVFLRNDKIGLRNRALSGSGHEVKGEHIFDPRARVKKARQLQVWMAHPSPTLADGLSTAFMVMSLDEIAAYCQKHAEVWALVFTHDKKSFMFGRGKI
ncbi:MAG: FAD:protein FMN transferase [Candidatus Aminicenantes bacterium]|nr:FAD:protein FMN transferase [Candidatus Aminicenantes bacterium]